MQSEMRACLYGMTLLMSACSGGAGSANTPAVEKTTGTDQATQTSTGTQ